MNVLAFGASYSKTSINKAFATYVAQQLNEVTVHTMDLNDFALPVFTVDREEEIGHPDVIHEFLEYLQWADLCVISMAEHNGAYTAGFKNLFDWTSRVKLKMFENKPMLLLSASPGGRGAQSSLELAKDRFPRHGADIIAYFSLPKFNDNFDAEKGVTDPDLKSELDTVIETVNHELYQMR